MAEVIDEGKRLLDSARKAGTPIFHIMHDAGPDSPYDVTADIGQIAQAVAPGPNEPVIVKHYPNSFLGTQLDALLRERAIQNLILTGFMTHMCVNSTACGAFNLGYRATVVASATATRDPIGPDGEPVKSVKAPKTVEQAQARAEARAKAAAAASAERAAILAERAEARVIDEFPAASPEVRAYLKRIASKGGKAAPF